MIQFHETNIKDIALHFVGNKNNDEPIKCSHAVLDFDETTKDILINYFIKPFVQKEEYYTFGHDIDLNMNEIFSCASEILIIPKHYWNNRKILPNIYTNKVRIPK